jgi:hypothetical protein
MSTLQTLDYDNNSEWKYVKYAPGGLIVNLVQYVYGEANIQISFCVAEDWSERGNISAGIVR